MGFLLHGWVGPIFLLLVYCGVVAAVMTRMNPPHDAEEPLPAMENEEDAAVVAEPPKRELKRVS